MVIKSQKKSSFDMLLAATKNNAAGEQPLQQYVPHLMKIFHESRNVTDLHLNTRLYIFSRGVFGTCWKTCVRLFSP